MPFVFHTLGGGAVENYATGEGLGAYFQVLPLQDWVQVGACRRVAAAFFNIAVERRKAFLPVAVDVVGQLIAGFLHGFKQCLEQWAGGRAAGQVQRAVVAATRIIGVGALRGFHFVEIR